MKNKAVFLDRDNTLIEDKGYVYQKRDLKWKKGAKSGLEMLSKMGYIIIVISNQSGIARGYFTENDVDDFHKYMNDDLYESNGLKVDKYYYSPFHPSGEVGRYKKKSNCRKPGNVLFIRAIKEFNISASQSIAIGDKNSDLEPALKCGVVCNFLITESPQYIIKNSANIKVVQHWYELINILKSPNLVDSFRVA